MFVVHTDTSSGITSDLAALRAAIDATGHPALFVVDVVASLGAAPFAMDALRADVVVGASQKGLMCPPGVGFVAVGLRAMELARANPAPRFYWDWVRRLSELSYRKFCGTAPQSLIAGLEVALGLLFAEGLEAVWGYQPSVQAMRDLLDIFTCTSNPQIDELARMRFEASIRPGVQEAFSQMFPAPRQHSVDRLAHADAVISAITAPTLIVHGREDQVIPLSASLNLLGLIPRAQLHVFGQCGHWTQIEHAEAFNSLVLDFLGRVSPQIDYMRR